MFKWLLENSLANRLLVLIAAAVLMAYGAFTLSRTPVDVFPDLNKPTVTVMTEAGGMAAEEVEQLITFPLESVTVKNPRIPRMICDRDILQITNFLYSRDNLIHVRQGQCFKILRVRVWGLGGRDAFHGRVEVIERVFHYGVRYLGADRGEIVRFFGDHKAVGLLDRVDDRVDVQRFYCPRVDDLDRYIKFFLHLLSRLECKRNGH